MKLIDADAFRHQMYQEVFEKDSNDQKWDSGCWIRYRLFEKVLEKQPAVDAIEIIKCKDCKHRILNKHYGEKGHLQIKAYCELDTGNPFDVSRDSGNDNWFCADAERK